MVQILVKIKDYPGDNSTTRHKRLVSLIDNNTVTDRQQTSPTHY